MAEYAQSGLAEGIDYSDCERSLRTDHGEVYPVGEREGLEAGDVGILDGHALRLCGYSGIARSTVYLIYLGAARKRVHDCVFTAAAAHYQYFLSHDINV